MAYTKSADGVAQRGKTNVTVMANAGFDVTPKTEGKGGKGSALGKSMKAVGRNMARVKNQKRGG